MMVKNPIFLALDVSDYDDMVHLISKLHPYVHGFKLGYQLLFKYSIKKLSKAMPADRKLFLDMKLYDIPNTMYAALDSISEINPDYVTVHIQDNWNIMYNLVEHVSMEYPFTKLLGVTRLTSLSTNSAVVCNNIKTSFEVGLDGVVCPTSALKFLNGKLKSFVPGTRLFSPQQDHALTVTPLEAIEKGADYLVIGREVINASDPVVAIKAILKSLND